MCQRYIFAGVEPHPTPAAPIPGGLFLPDCPEYLLEPVHANTAEKRNSYYDAALEELEETIPALNTVESEYDAKELAAYINRFLKELSYDDRYLFVRRYWYADSVSRIAGNMGIQPHAASVRLFRLREKLQAFLQKEGMIA